MEGLVVSGDLHSIDASVFGCAGGEKPGRKNTKKKLQSGSIHKQHQTYHFMSYGMTSGSSGGPGK